MAKEMEQLIENFSVIEGLVDELGLEFVWESL